MGVASIGGGDEGWLKTVIGVRRCGSHRFLASVLCAADTHTCVVTWQKAATTIDELPFDPPCPPAALGWAWRVSAMKRR
jgi:hypothetical protein